MVQQEDFSKYNGEGTSLRQAQLRMLHILIEVDKICRKHNITYWIHAGTLLGAVRHRGFIPWDDDLDISIHKKDVKKLKKSLTEELPNDLIFQDSKNDFNHPFLFPRVRDKFSHYDADLPYKVKYDGIFIDILPVEEIPSFKIKKCVDYVYGHSYRSLHNQSKSIPDLLLSLLCYFPSVLLANMLRIIPIICHVKKLGHIYGWPSVNLIDKRDVYPVKEIEFEGCKFYAPNNPDNVLKAFYGDYMLFPAEDNRIIRATKIEFVKD